MFARRNFLSMFFPHFLIHFMSWQFIFSFLSWLKGRDEWNLLCFFDDKIRNTEMSLISIFLGGKLFDVDDKRENLWWVWLLKIFFWWKLWKFWFNFGNFKIKRKSIFNIFNRKNALYFPILNAFLTHSIHLIIISI